MSNIVDREKVKEVDAVVLPYIEDVSIEMSHKTSLLKKTGLSKMNMFDRKTAKMEETLKRFPIPTREL